MRHRVIAVLLCLSLLLIPAFVALSQDAAPAATLDLMGVNANELPTLILTTNVINRTGQPLLGLGVSDFVLGGPLADRAQIIEVENITEDDLAFAAVLVIDTSTSMDGLPLEQAKVAARAFINTLGPNDPIAIVTFDSSERVVQDYTTDKDVLLAAIDNLAYGGQTALYDGTVLGIETAALAPIPRRAVILLSDGAEYGGISEAERDTGLQNALDRGVPVFTVGLGYGIDRSYLREISEGSSATYYESPSPEELPEIYRTLAQTFRSQYIVTVELSDFDLKAEAGQTTDFTLYANIPNGSTNIVSSSLRVPVSSPIVTLPDDLFANALTEPTEVQPTIVADDAITSVVFTTSEGSTEADSITIDPATLAPGTYPLSITVTDVTDDVTTITTEFTIAALPSTITLNGLPDTPITQPTTLTVTGEGQTPLLMVSYRIGEIGGALLNKEEDFAYEFDPVRLAAGEHTVVVTAENEGGLETTLEQTFTVGDVAPRIDNIGVTEGQVIDGLTTLTPGFVVQPGRTLDSTALTVNGVDAVDLSIDPSQLEPGDAKVTLSVIDDVGQTTQAETTVEIATLPPAVSIAVSELISEAGAEASIHVEAQPGVRITDFEYSFDGDAAETGTLDADGNGIIPIPVLGNGTHALTVSVSAAEGAVTTRNELFTVAIATATPTNTATATATDTPTNTPTDTPTSTPTATPTLDATATAQARESQTQGAVNVENTAAARTTLNAINTKDAATLVAVDTATSLAMVTQSIVQTAAAQVTAEARRTQIANANANAVQTATADAQATLDTRATFTALPGLTETALLNSTQMAQETATQSGNAAATRNARSTDVAEAAQTATAFIGEVTQTAISQITQQAEVAITENAGATATGQAVAQAVQSATALIARSTQNAAASATAQSRDATATQSAALTETRAALDATFTQIAAATSTQSAELTATQSAALTETRAALDATFTQIAGATNTQVAALTATRAEAIAQTTQVVINILSTSNARATVNAATTFEFATLDAGATATVLAAETREVITAVAQSAIETLTALPTMTFTPGPSATPAPPLIELDSERSPIQGLLDSLTGNPLTLVCIPVLCLLGIIVLFVLGGRRRRQG